MGKSNRIKANRAAAGAVTLGNYKKKEGMPNWAVNLIAIAITVAILLSGIALALSASGTVMRMRTAVRSENFRVNGKMMTYFVNTKYQNFVSNYSAYMSSLSLDPSKPLKDQKFGDTSVNANALDTMLFGEFEGTWFDYFMAQATDEVKSMLYYCEEAKAMGLSLDDDDKKSIDDAIASLEATATSYGYPLNAYIAASFGEGVKEKDIRRALELSELATKGMNALSDKLLAAIGEDRVATAYEADSIHHNIIDYTFYGFRVDYEDVSKEMKAANASVTDAEILAEYKKQIEETQAKADALLAIAENGTLEEFEKAVLKLVAEENYDAELEDATLPTEGKPTEEQLTAIRDGIIADSVKEFMDGAEATDAIKTEGEKYIGYGVEMSKEWAELFNKIKGEVYDMVSLSRASYVKDNVKHLDKDTFSTWAFDAARKVDDVHKILLGDGSEAGAEITNKSGYFRADVYRMRATQHKDTAKTKNLAYMTFGTEAEAKAAIEALKAAGTVDQATFDRIAAEKSAMSDIIENYVKGDMGSTEFDNWVFADGRAIGNYTDKPIKLSSSSYAVLYYTADGQEAWFVSVKTELFNDDFEAYFANLEKTVEIDVKDNVLKRIKIGSN